MLHTNSVSMFMIHLHIKLHITSFSDRTQILCSNHVVHLTSLNKFTQKHMQFFPELMLFCHASLPLLLLSSLAVYYCTIS